jgi:hypothetical protein
MKNTRAAILKAALIPALFLFPPVLISAATDAAALTATAAAVPAPSAGTTTAMATPPKSPDLLQVNADGMKINIVWGSFENDKITFNIYRSTSEKDGFVKINKAPLTDNQFSDEKGAALFPLKSNVTYFYKVTALDGGAESPDSNILSATPAGALSPPEDIRAIPGLNHITLKWTEPGSAGLFGVTGYNIFRSTVDSLFVQLNGTTYTAVEYDDKGLTNGARYTYMLQTIDNAGNTSAISSPLTSVPFEPVGAPKNVTSLVVSSESIKLSWDMSKAGGTFEISGYNIYRSTQAGVFADTPINNRLWKGLKSDDGKTIFFNDNMIWSYSKPMPGVGYYYKIEPVDVMGNTGASSDVLQGMIPLVDVSKSGILTADISEYGLPPESRLSLSGKKSLQMSYEHIWWRNTTNQPDNFDIQQKLRLKLTGNIGRKINVDVNYDETILTDEYTKISISYTGDKDESLQEVAFGDMDLQVPSTKYLSYSPQKLFGIKGKINIGDKLDLTLIAAQSKGVTAIQTFSGNLRKKTTNGRDGVDIYDTSFIANQYYYITKDPKVVIKPGSVIIYRDDAIATDNITSIASTPTGTYHFDLLYSGVDYVVDYSTNIVKFSSPMQYNYIIAAGYYDQTNNRYVGLVNGLGQGNFDFNEAHLVSDTNGITQPGETLLQNGNKSDLSHKVLNYYSMQGTQIYNPQDSIDKSGFKIVVEKADGTTSYFIPQPTDPVNPYTKWYTIDTNFGILKFSSFFPFTQSMYQAGAPAPDSTTAANISTEDGQENDAYNLNNPITNFKIHLEYNYYVSSYKLDNSPVVYGSERIEKDGVALKRDKDYNIIYETGDINFVDKNSILPTTVIKVVYEYMPFVASTQSNLFGGILNYNMSDNVKLNSTLLYKNSSAGTTVPDARSTETSLTTPFSSLILDNNVNVALTRENINGIISALPMVDKSNLPVDFKFTGEMAYSSFNPNTFQQTLQSGGTENGVAMIDSMESADLSNACDMTLTKWFPAALPQFPIGLQPEDRAFMSHDNVQEQGHTPVDPNNPTSAVNQVTMLRFQYSNLTNTRWDSFRYIYSQAGDNLNLYSAIEMWVYVDTNQPVKMSVDMGVVSESSNGDLNFQYNEKYGALHDSEDYVDTATNVVPNGIFTTDKDRGISPGIYTGLPGSTPAYWGANNAVLDTEDMNNNGIMDGTADEAYYQFASEGGGVNHPEFYLTGNGTWTSIKIPLKDITRAVGSVIGDPNDPNFMSMIKHVRLNFIGTSSTPASGTIKIESIKFTGNSWRVQALSGVTDAAGNTIIADTTKLNAETVNQTTDPNYVYNSNYFAYSTTSDLQYETSLKLTNNMTNYDLTPDGRPLYYVNKILNSKTSGYDYHAYKYIKFDVYIPHKAAPQNGRVIFLRIGSNTDYTTNYFQFNEQYSNIAEGKWITLIFALDGSDGKRTTPVYPSLPNIREIQYISIGVINPNTLNIPAVAGGEILYIDNIRLTDAKTQVGTAKAATSTLNYKGVGSVTQSYEDRETDFNTMADAGTGAIQQHYTAQNVTLNYTQLPFMPITSTYFKTAQYTDAEYKNDIGYTNNDQLGDVFSEGVNNYVTFSLVPDMQLSANSTIKNVKTIYYGVLINDFESNINNYWSVSPALAWKVPSNLFFIPLGTNNISAKMLIENTGLNYYVADDSYGNSINITSQYYDQQRYDRTQNYSWTGNYSIAGLIMGPSYAYNLVEEKGNITAQYSYYLNYLNSITHLYVGDFILLKREITPKVSLSYPTAWIFSPQLNYTHDYNLDLTQDALNTHGRLDASSGLKLSSIFPGFPDITSYSFSVDSTNRYDNLAYPDSFDMFSHMTFERQWDAMLWKMVLTGENNGSSISDREMQAYENIASNGAFVITHSLNLSEIKLFGFMGILPSTASYSSNTSFSSRGASASYMENENVNIQSLYFNNITIPLPVLRDLFTKQTLSAGYTYTRQISMDSNKTIISDAITNKLNNLQISYSTGPDGVKGALALSGSWTNTISGLMSYWADNISPTLTMTYNLKLTKPITIPGWLPFIGDKTFRLDQAININGSFGVVKNWGGGVNDANTHMVNSTQYAFTSNAAYNVMQNLKITAELDYSHLDDMVVRTNSNDRFKISITGEIEF